MSKQDKVKKPYEIVFSILKYVVSVSIFILIFNFIVSAVMNPPSLLNPLNIVRSIVFLILLALIIYFDKSGIRAKIFKNYPKTFIHAKRLRMKTRKKDVITEYYKTATWFFVLLSWFSPYLKFIFTGVAIILPVLSILRYINHNDIISFLKGKEKLSSTALTILLPATFFIFRRLENQNFNSLFLLLLIIIVSIIMFQFFSRTFEYKKKKSIAVGFFLCIVYFVFGSLCAINSDFDFNEPHKYIVTVIDKRISEGKNMTSEYITVTPWNEYSENKEIKVGLEIYNKTKLGEKITVFESRGALGMEWYYIE